jgi:diguanylate cyclase (GGDEF)-like protein/PAS domain S-box-containing protein
LVVAAGDGAIVYANARTEALTGFTRHELVGKPVQLLIASDLLGRSPGTRLESLCRTAEGSELPVEIHIGTVSEPEPLLVVTVRDIRERIAAREARFEAEAKYRSLVEHIPAVVYLDPVDEDSLSMYVSPQVRELIGITPDEWVSDYYAWRNHVHPDDIDRAFDEYQQAYRDHVPLNHEYRMVHEDGTVKWVLEQAFPIDDEEGRPWLIQGVIFDITERKEAEEQIAFLAYHDKLTGLPNRHLFEEMLDNAIARARRAGRGIGVLYLDLDNFKQVNDSLGHHAGDLLLAQLADRLRLCTRDTDLVARQGGDEFLLLLVDLDLGEGAPGEPDPAVEIACSVAARVRGALDEPFDLAGTPVQATGSIGLSLFPRDAMDAETLLKNADQAMYRAKRGGVQGHVSFAAP